MPGGPFGPGLPGFPLGQGRHGGSTGGSQILGGSPGNPGMPGRPGLPGAPFAPGLPLGPCDPGRQQPSQPGACLFSTWWTVAFLGTCAAALRYDLISLITSLTDSLHVSASDLIS